MADVTIDAYTNAQSNDTASLLWYHTCTAADLLVVGVQCAGNNSVTGVTYNGVPLTLITWARNSAGESDTRVEWWRLVAPAAGLHQVIVTLASSGRVIGGSVSLKDTLQSQPIGAYSTASGVNATPTAVVASASGQMVLDAMGASPLPVTAVCGAGQTQRWNQTVLKSWYTRGGGSSELGAASVTMSWDLSEANPWVIIAITIVPAPPVAAYFDVRCEALQLASAQASVRCESLGFAVSQSLSVPYEGLGPDAITKPLPGSGLVERVPAGTPDGRGNS